MWQSPYYCGQANHVIHLSIWGALVATAELLLSVFRRLISDDELSSSGCATLSVLL